MQVVLVLFTNDGERRSFSIARDTTIVGRRNDCDLCIPVGDVSRKHCRLIKTDDSARLEDLGSSNGTYVNGQRIQEAVLNPGDWIQVGPVQFCVQLDGVPSDEELAQRPAGAADDTAAALVIDSDASGAAPSPDASASDLLIEEPGDSNAKAAGHDSDLEELPLDDLNLEDSSSSAGGIDSLELEELPGENE